MIIDSAGRWLLASGIREPNGGVARYYRVEEAVNLPVSTEITGYAASAFAFFHETTGEEAYRDAAVRTARFLAGEAWSGELQTFPFECHAGAPAYFFDCGIIVRGLLRVHRLTGDERLLDIARRCGESMARDFLTAAAIHPVISLPGKEPLPYLKRWSREPGCFQLKAALVFQQLGMGDCWKLALRHALESAPSFLPGALEEEQVMDRLHAFCYFLEALLAEAGDATCAAVLGDSIRRVAGYLRAIAPRVERSDVYAQLLRVRLYAAALGMVRLDERQAEEEAAAIPAFQYRCADPRLNGGFSFGRRNGRLLPFANPVSTVFCAQALECWRRWQAGGFEANLEQLI